MPLKLVAPREGRSPNWRIRGTYLRVRVDQTAGTPVERVARQELKKIQREIEAGRFRHSGAPTFGSAAVAYIDAGGEETFIRPILRHLADTPLANIDQATVDHVAKTLFPAQTAATRNRCVYTPISAVLRHAGVAIVLRRPKGAQGQRRTDFLWPDQAEALFAAATPDPEWRAFLVLLVYTGLRVNEAIGLTCNQVRLSESLAVIPQTKNGEPRGVHLPPAVVAELANLPAGLERGEQRVFPRYSTNNPTLYQRFATTLEAAGIAKPVGVAFHMLRHTYGTWMRKFAGLTPEQLRDTRAWKTVQAARRYDHADVSDAARAADLLPTKAKRA